MAIAKIKQSVGKRGRNNPPDTKIIQIALNKHASKAKFKKLVEDSDCGPRTIAAIIAFQTNVMGVKPDGKVDPGKATIKALSLSPTAAKKEAEKEQAASSGGGEATKAPRALKKKSGVVTSGVNKRLLFLVQEVATHYEQDIMLTDGFRTPARMANTLYNNWKGQKYGKNYRALRNNEEFRVKLDNYHKKKDKTNFVKEATAFAQKNKGMSWHMKGEAVDVRRSTVTSAMKKTLLLYLKSYNASGSQSFIHFDTAGRTLKTAYSEADKAKWRK